MPSSAALSFSERQLLHEACAAFQRTTRRFKAKPLRESAVKSGAARGTAMDGVIQFDINGQKFNMPVLVKSRVDASGIVVAQHRTFVGEPNGLNRPLMVVTQHVATGTRNLFIAEQIYDSCLAAPQP